VDFVGGLALLYESTLSTCYLLFYKSNTHMPGMPMQLWYLHSLFCSVFASEGLSRPGENPEKRLSGFRLAAL